MKKLRTQVFGFSLIESQFESVVSFKPDVTANANIKDLFSILDNDHDGRIDGLEFVAGLIIVCRATFDEKVKLLFEAFGKLLLYIKSQVVIFFLWCTF